MTSKELSNNKKIKTVWTFLNILILKNISTDMQTDRLTFGPKEKVYEVFHFIVNPSLSNYQNTDLQILLIVKITTRKEASPQFPNPVLVN